MTVFRDSLGITHVLHEQPEPLLKAGPAAIAADPDKGQFRALVDDMIALRQRRRRVAAKVKVKVNTRDPKAEKEAELVSRADHISPTPAPLKKSLESLARDARRMAAEIQRQTEEIQRDHARALIDDLDAKARAGKLDPISAAKVDALAHRHARALGLERTGVRS